MTQNAKPLAACVTRVEFCVTGTPVSIGRTLFSALIGLARDAVLGCDLGPRSLTNDRALAREWGKERHRTLSLGRWVGGKLALELIPRTRRENGGIANASAKISALNNGDANRGHGWQEPALA